MKTGTIVIYTDGSCNPAHGVGAWAVILFIDKKKFVLSGMEKQTTHQRMELQAVIKGFEYLAHANLLTRPAELYTDSQYVCGIPARKTKLKVTGYSSARNLPVRNADLVREMIVYIEMMNVQFIKVKAHQKEGGQNSNREVDKLARKMVREMIEGNN